MQSRAADLLTGFARSLERRGIPLDAYLQASGTSPEDLQRQMILEAAVSIARELALEALAERAGIAVSDDDVKEYLREEAANAGEEDVDGLIEDVWAHGQQESIREDLRLRAALDRLVADVKPIAPDLAAAREKLWTPEKEKEKAEGDTKLWTPAARSLHEHRSPSANDRGGNHVSPCSSATRVRASELWSCENRVCPLLLGDVGNLPVPHTPPRS